MNDTTNFKAQALNEVALRTQAPSIFAAGPMQGVSDRYTFVPTVRIIEGLREHDWVPVEVEEQRIGLETRRGFQKTDHEYTSPALSGLPRWIGLGDPDPMRTWNVIRFAFNNM